MDTCGFSAFILKGKNLLHYINLFSAIECEKIDKIMQMEEKKPKMKMEKTYCAICGKYRKFKSDKISYMLEKTLVLYFKNIS